MGSKEKGELIERAIQQLNKINKSESPDNEGEHHRLLTRLLTQLETTTTTTTTGDGEELHQPQLSVDPDDDEVLLPSPLAVGKVKKKKKKKKKRESTETSSSDENEITAEEEILKELRKMRRQNFITHCLLSVMIVLTFGWQLSQVSLILKVKEGFNHPFRSFGGMLRGMLKAPNFNNNAQNGEKESSTTKHQEEKKYILSPLQVPELPHMDLSGFVLSSDED